MEGEYYNDLVEKLMYHYGQNDKRKNKSNNFFIEHLLKDDRERHLTRHELAKPFHRRVRTIFTKKQLEKLEEKFSTQQYLVGKERIEFAQQLGLNEIQVKVWFQNRRIKWRRTEHERTLARLEATKQAEK